MRAITTRLGFLATLALLLCAAPASARQVQQYFYSGTSFEAGGESARAIAFDAVNQKVLVVNGQSVNRFTSDGLPDGFSGLGGATSFVPDSENQLLFPSIAVDNSTAPSAGNFYVTSGLGGTGKVYGYTADGTVLPGFPIATRPCGLAVTPSGNLWVASLVVGYREYTSAGVETGKHLFFPGGKNGCLIDLDSAGNVYAVKGSGVEKFSPDLTDLGFFAPKPSSLGVDRADGSVFALSGGNVVTQYDPLGDPLAVFGGADPAHSYSGLSGATGLAVNPQNNDVFVAKPDVVDVFSRDAAIVTTPTVTTGDVTGLSGPGATLHGTLNPDGATTTDCHFEWGVSTAYGKIAPCTEGDIFAGGSGDNAVSATIAGLVKGTTYHFRLVSKNANGALAHGRDATLSAAAPPQIGNVGADHITTDSARVVFDVNPNGGATTYRVEIGTDPDFGSTFPVPDAAPTGLSDSKTILTTQRLSQGVSGLAPATTYFYRVVATNPSGKTEDEYHTFTTFATSSTAATPCPNSLARQQTGSAGLFDCRAYELVSAPFTGGYDVRSDLTAQAPLANHSNVSGAALYSMSSGTIPGIAGNPTNRGADPYVATRGADGWSTRYVGLPANNSNATGPFSSPLLAADSTLHSFAFGGSDICNPCFPDGSTNVPIRLPSGGLVPGMAGSIDPGPADPEGEIRKPLSDDGRHFFFGSTAQYEPAANSNGTDLTIYDRDLTAGTTQVVSTDESGGTIQNGQGVAELDVSADGLRVVIGKLISTDPAGNRYYHLYMHVGSDPNAIDLTPGSPSGAIYGGMDSAGTMVYFTTKDALGTAADQDSDASADLYRADVSASAATLSRVSAITGAGTGGTGDTDSCDPAANSAHVHWNSLDASANCDVVAIGGGGGVASVSGSIYFLSPELLDGPAQGVLDAPNLYRARPGGSLSFVTTFESSANFPVPPPAHNFKESLGSPVNAAAAAIDHSDGSTYVLDDGDGSGLGGQDKTGIVEKYDSSGHLDTGFGSGGKITGLYTEGSGAEGLGILPTSIAVDNDPTSASYRDLYVPSPGSFTLNKYSPSGQLLSELFVFDYIAGVTVDSNSGDVYVVGDFGTVHVYDDEGNPLREFAVSSFFEALDIGIDSAGNTYIATGSKILKYGPDGSSLGEFASGPARGVKVDPADDHVYVDEGNWVIEYTPAGDAVGDPIGEGEISSSLGLAVDSGTVVVSNAGHHNFAVYGPRMVSANRAYDQPLVIDSVGEAATRRSEEFEVTPSGEDAVFASVLPLDGNAFDSAGHYEIFRAHMADASHPVACISCSPTGAVPSGDAALAAYGLSLADDGRVFFTSAEPLALRDSNERLDAYEWKDGALQLISAGTSPADSSLLSVSPDGKDAFFFTREKLVSEDQNGAAVRLYTAREQGGFSHGPPAFQCAASDECHGASSPPAPPLAAGTTAGTPGQFSAEKKARCRKGEVKRRGRCVRRHSHKRRHQHKRTSTKRGNEK